MQSHSTKHTCLFRAFDVYLLRTYLHLLTVQRTFTSSGLIYSKTENRMVVSWIVGEIFPSLLIQSEVTTQILTTHTGVDALTNHYHYEYS
jgi:hypothetical protein